MCEDVNQGGQQRSWRRLRAGVAVSYVNQHTFHRGVLEKCITLRNADTKYVEFSECTKTLTALHRVLEELGREQDVTMTC